MTITTVLGFDYGERRIGIAVGQTITGNASPLETITTINQKPDWTKIQKIIQ
ncbi:MAG: Holliday junction resolvase RuvX, partial [Gammaproteobacteria bacterium]|nr:Holliday junction resolvase RuvX [Gammaproteobacteria bacterium]